MSDTASFQLMWYNSPLFVALVSVLLTLVVTQISFWIQRWLMQKEQAEIIKVAFKGEVNAIRLILKRVAKFSIEIYKEKKPITKQNIEYPKTVFEANAGNLGTLRDPSLAGHLANLYSFLQELKVAERNVLDKTYNIVDYLLLIISTYKSAILLDISLSAQTRHIRGPHWETKITEKDADELNFCNETLEQLIPEKVNL